MRFAAAVLGVWGAAATSEGRVEDQQRAALTRMVDAVNAGDARSYASVYAPDAVITIYGGGELRGRAAIEQHEVELLGQFPGARLAFGDVWQKGARAVVHYAVNGRTSSGQSMGHEGLLFFRFLPSGLIEEEHRYLDSLTPMAQMGLLGSLPARPLPSLPAELKQHTAEGSPEEERNVATATASFATLDASNGLARLSALADDAVLDELMEPRSLRGTQDVTAYFQRWTRAVPDASTEVTTALGVGEHVLMETLVRGTLKGPFGPLTAASKPFLVHRAVVVRVKDGRLVRVTGFMNGKELASAVGQWPLQGAK